MLFESLSSNLFFTCFIIYFPWSWEMLTVLFMNFVKYKSVFMKKIQKYHTPYELLHEFKSLKNVSWNFNCFNHFYDFKFWKLFLVSINIVRIEYLDTNDFLFVLFYWKKLFYSLLLIFIKFHVLLEFLIWMAHYDLNFIIS